jgi:hypothetical protein
MDQAQPRRPATLTISLLFILLDGLVWLVFGIIILIGAHPALPDLPYLRLFYVTASFAIASLLFVLLFFLLRRNRVAFILVLTMQGATILLTIADQVGWSDLIVILLNIVPFVLLIKHRMWFMPAAPPQDSTT